MKCQLGFLGRAAAISRPGRDRNFSLGHGGLCLYSSGAALAADALV